MHGCDSWSTSHYCINLPVIWKIDGRVFLFVWFITRSTPPCSAGIFILFFQHLYLYVTLGYGTNVALLFQLFYHLGVGVDIPKVTLKLLLNVLLTPDLQEYLRFCIAPSSSLFLPSSLAQCHLFPRNVCWTTILHNIVAEYGSKSTPEVGSNNPDSIGIESQLNPDSACMWTAQSRLQWLCERGEMVLNAEAIFTCWTPPCCVWGDGQMWPQRVGSCVLSAFSLCKTALWYHCTNSTKFPETRRCSTCTVSSPLCDLQWSVIPPPKTLNEGTNFVENM